MAVVGGHSAISMLEVSDAAHYNLGLCLVERLQTSWDPGGQQLIYQPLADAKTLDKTGGLKWAWEGQCLHQITWFVLCIFYC